MKNYERNKKRRARSERKKEVVTKEDEVTENGEPTVEVTKVTEEESKMKAIGEAVTGAEEDKKGNKFKLDSLIQKLPCQYRPIDYLAESIKLKRDNKINIVPSLMDLLKR